MLSNSPALVSNLQVLFSETKISSTGSPKAPRPPDKQGGTGVRLLHSKNKTKNPKITNLKLQSPERKKKFTSLLGKRRRKKSKSETLLTVDFPTTTVSESPR